MASLTARFPIGTVYQTRGRHSVVCTVVDILTTTNSAGEVVSIRYVAEHDLMGMTIVDRTVCDTTIAMGLAGDVAA